MRDILIVTVFAALLALAGPAAGEGPSDWAQPQAWITRPTAADMDIVYPRRDSTEEISGAASAKCAVAADGRVKDCRILLEKPEGHGFGGALLKATPHFRIDMAKSPKVREGQFVILGLRFVIPDGGIVPIIKLQPGASAALVTPADASTPKKAALIPCASPASPDRQCQLHAFDWLTLPSWERSDALLGGADQKTGTSLVECKVGLDNRLSACRADSESARDRTALVELVSSFQPPKKASDGTIMAGRRVVLRFDWRLIAELRGYRPPDMSDYDQPVAKKAHR